MGLTAAILDFYPRPPRGGRRSSLMAGITASRHFYPRPPRGGRRCTASDRGRPRKFLSTPSARRATSTLAHGSPYIRHFYPRPPRGGRHPLPTGQGVYCYFYPRPPRGGRRPGPPPHPAGRVISIHALREEGDQVGCAALLPIHISIHALREEGDSKTSSAMCRV